ncbi:MAG TPA: S9 family peptidase, partial [Thermoanaerobaculia bacterium]|nr:S9 family peptidase [Thermoanaerobaculia bacterium]
MLRLLRTPLLLAALLVALPGAAADTHPFSIHDMLAMDRISDVQLSPDGTQAAFVLRTTDLAANRGRTDLWLLDVRSKGVRRLTTHEAADSSPRWASDGKSLYFLSTRGGSQQVWRIPLAGGEAERVSSEPLDVDNLEVAPGGKLLVISMEVFPGKSPAETKAALDAKESVKASGMLYDRLFVRHWDTWKDGRRNHVFALPLGADGKAAGEAKDLMPAMDADAPPKPFGGLDDAAISPDGKTLVFTCKDVGREEAWSTNYDLWEVPTDGSAAPKRITTNPAWDSTPRFSPDGKTLAYAAMSRAGYEADRFEVVFRDLATGKDRSFTLRAGPGKNDDRSPASLTWSADGKSLLATADHLGQKALFAIDAATGRAKILLADGSVDSASPLGKDRILFARHSLLGPTEIYAMPVAGGAYEKLTSINDAKVAAARFGKPEQFTFTGAKGDTVYGWIVYPVDFDPAKKYPVAYLIHGGPQGSFGNDFHYRWNPQAYAGAGYATVMIDFHASTGYGQAFTDAVNGDWGGAPYEDLMKGLDFVLGKYAFLDGNRVGALGASYGGYMINWIHGQTDRFRCLVVHDGNLDERMAYYDTEELWFPEWENGGTPWTAKSFGHHNPIDYVKNWKTPTLVIHGQKD